MTLIDAIREAKRSISCRSVCERYGVKVTPSGFALCPWHDDARPSMKVYDGQKGVYCFACGKGGSCIDLTMALHNEPLRDSVQRLITDFNLNITLDGSKKTYAPPPPDYKRLYAQELHDHAEDMKDLARLVELALGGQSAAIEQYIDQLEDRLYHLKHDERRAS